MVLDLGQFYSENAGSPLRTRIITSPTYVKGRVVSITTKVTFGKDEEVNRLLEASPVSKGVNISFVERNNLALRQQSRRLAFIGYHNCVRVRAFVFSGGNREKRLSQNADR